MLVPLIALIPLQYDGRRIAAGEAFVARSREDARVLTLLARASIADTDPPKRRTYRRRDLTAESE